MNVREIDEPIPDDEKLYRTLAVADVVGAHVRETAIDLDGMSVFRAKYCKEPKLALAARPQHVGVAEVVPGALPPAMKLSTGVEFEAFAVDAPELWSAAHAEVRVHRTADRPAREPFKPKSTSAKLELRAWLASKLVVVITPTVATSERPQPHGADAKPAESEAAAPPADAPPADAKPAESEAAAPPADAPPADAPPADAPPADAKPEDTAPSP